MLNPAYYHFPLRVTECLRPVCTHQDFGNGGAFPECHVAQYPLGMGADKGSSSSSSNVLAVQLDAQGKVKYDVLARQGHSKDKVSFLPGLEDVG